MSTLLTLPKELRLDILENLLVVDQSFNYLPPAEAVKGLCYKALHINKQLRQEGIDVLRKNNTWLCVVTHDPLDRFLTRRLIYWSDAIEICPHLFPIVLDAHITFKTHTLQFRARPSRGIFHQSQLKTRYFAYTPRTYAGFCMEVYYKCMETRAVEVVLHKGLGSSELLEPLYYWRGLAFVDFSTAGQSLLPTQEELHVQVSLWSAMTSQHYLEMASQANAIQVFQPLVRRAQGLLQAHKWSEALCTYEAMLLLSNAFNVPHESVPTFPALCVNRAAMFKAAVIAVQLLTPSSKRRQNPSVEEAFAATNLAHRCLSSYTKVVCDTLRTILHEQRATGHYYLGQAFERAGNIKLAMACYEKAAVDLFHYTEQQEHLRRPIQASLQAIQEAVHKRLGWHHIPKDGVFCVTGRVPLPNEGPIYEHGSHC